jgi:biopolymer transport protein ExbD
MAAERKSVKEESLNLVPIMNLVTILIPVLLMAIKSVEIAVIDTTLPAIGAPSSKPPDVPTKPPLNLSLGILKNGIQIIGANEFLYPNGAPPVSEGVKSPPTIPCKSGGSCRNVDDYDWDDLNKKLVSIKKMAKDEDRDSENVILVPDSTIRYEILVKTMDTSREDANDKKSMLFPSVVIAGGAQ